MCRMMKVVRKMTNICYDLNIFKWFLEEAKKTPNMTEEFKCNYETLDRIVRVLEEFKEFKEGTDE